MAVQNSIKEQQHNPTSPLKLYQQASSLDKAAKRTCSWATQTKINCDWLSDEKTNKNM